MPETSVEHPAAAPPRPVPPFSDREKAREAGRKSGAERARRAKLREEDPEALMREEFSGRAPELTRALLDAALGTGDWHDLPLEKRLDALKRALEYAVGRPTARKDSEPATPEEGGLSIE